MDAKKAAAATAIAAWWRSRNQATNSDPDPHPSLWEEVIEGRDEFGHFAFTVSEDRGWEPRQPELGLSARSDPLAPRTTR